MILCYMNKLTYYAHSDWLIGLWVSVSDFIIEMRYHVAIAKKTFFK